MRLPMKSGHRADSGGGDLIIDETRTAGQGETGESFSNNMTPLASPYAEGGDEGAIIRNNNNNASYEQLSFSKPSASTLSLLASSKNTTSKNPYSKHQLYLRGRTGSEDKDEYFGPSSTVHSNGIWTPGSVSSTSYSQDNYEDYTVHHPTTNEQTVPGSGNSTSGESLMVRPSGSVASGSGFNTYEVTSNNSSPNEFQHHQQQRQFNNRSANDSPIPVETTIKNAFLTQDKADCLCDVMLRDKNYAMLAHILHDLPKGIQESENILRSRAALAYHSGNFQLLYNIIESRMFSSRHHRELQELYQSARYAEAEKQRGRPLGAVDKYRIRRKHALPRTIWDGESTSYTFKDRDRKMLIEAYLKNTYPTGETKKELQFLTGLDKKQIDNWFKNRRQRDRPLDQKPGKKSSRNGCQDGGLVMTPQSSGGSGSSAIMYANVPYHSPMDEDSMEQQDIKYPPFQPPKPTAAQIKAYAAHNENIIQPLPTPKGSKGVKRGKSSPNSIAWAKGAAAIVGEKVAKKKQKTKDIIEICENNNNNNSALVAYNGAAAANYHELYALSANQNYGRGMRVSSPGGVMGDEDIIGANGDKHATSLQSFQTLQGHHHHQQYPPGACGSVIINHHHQSGLAVGAWGPAAWHHSANAASSIGSGDAHSYSPMSILPSLAATFNHHSHHHHHHGIPQEARIQVQ